jgi:hypothetical protein
MRRLIAALIVACACAVPARAATPAGGEPLPLHLRGNTLTLEVYRPAGAA